MRKTFLFILLFTASAFQVWANNAKETNFGSEIDVYANFSPIDVVNLFVGEEITLTNFLTPQNGIFDACNTVVGITYTPHPNVALETAYEFLYANALQMEHVLKLAIVPTVSMGNVSIYLKETAQMTHATADTSTSWQWVSELNVSYAIANTPLTTYAYIEMTNPLEASPAHWYDEICYRAGLDWEVTPHHTLGLYYEFSHTPSSYMHLIGTGYTLSF